MKTKTYKIVYYPKNMMVGVRGVAFMEAENRSLAMFAFQREYAGQFHTVESCTEFG